MFQKSKVPIPHSAAFSSTSDFKRKRKISKVKTKSKSQKDELAESVIKGNLQKIEDIIDVLDSLYGKGFSICLSYKYQYNHQTDTVRVQDVADKELDGCIFSNDLNIIHLACIFDQDQVLELLSRYGLAVMRESVHSKEAALVSSWYGALSALDALHRLGFNVMALDVRKRTCLHLAAERDHHKVVEYLLTSHDDIVDIEDSEGRTALHYSSQHSAVNSLSVLLSHGAAVNCPDTAGLSPLHLSTEHHVVTRLLQHGADPCLSTVTSDTGETVTVFSHLLRTVPEECGTLLTSLITSNGLSLSASDLQLSLSFRLWQREMKLTESDGLLRFFHVQILIYFNTNVVRIAASEQTELLKHPVTESFLHLKNAQVGWLYLAANLVFYLAFLVSMTGLIFTNHSSWFITLLAESQGTAHVTFLSLTLIFLVVYILIEIFKVFVIFDINLDNAYGYFSWLFILTISTVYTAMISDPNTVSPDTTHQLAAIVITLVWVYVLVVLAIFPFLGIYLLMLKRVALVLTSFLVLLSFVIIAFALSFHLLVPGVEYETPLASVLTTLSMMFGEVNFSDRFTTEKIQYHGATEITIVCFIIFIGIVIVNFLIGVSIDNMTNIFQFAGLARLNLTVQQLSLLDRILYKLGRLTNTTIAFQSIFATFHNIGGAEDSAIYIYPNNKGIVFIKSKSGDMIETKYNLPPWVIKNILKTLKEKELENLTKEKETDNEKGLRGIRREVVSVKKDIKSIQRDLQIVCEFIKFNNK